MSDGGEIIDEERRADGGEPAPERRAARHLRVSAGEVGQRVDNFLLARTAGVPRSHVYRLIRRGEVRVDGRRVRPTRRLLEGEQVRVPPLRTAEAVGPPRVPERLIGALGAAVVREEEDFVVVAKPEGLAVHGGSGLHFGLIDALRRALEAPRLELVHRLDRGTSGCLLVARDRARARALQALFRHRRVEKRYVALVAGRWPEEIGRVDAPLARNVEHAGERRVVVDPEGRPAASRFAVRRRLADATLVEVRIETGRTHQIRVHARHVGYPLVGDTRYGDNATNARFRRRGLKRLFLHAEALAFDWKGERVALEVPPGADWDRALAALEASSDDGRR